MTVRTYNYTAGKDVGIKKHSDGVEETLHGFDAFGEHTRYVNIPTSEGTVQANVLQNMRIDCPLDDCDGNHAMVEVEPTEVDGQVVRVIIECDKAGFLFCAVDG